MASPTPLTLRHLIDGAWIEGDGPSAASTDPVQVLRYE